MNTHVVQRFDSPFSIAARYTGAPQRMGELLAANPGKRTVVTGLGATFESLHVGEALALPASWLGGPQGLGACTPSSPLPDLPTAINTLTAILQGGATLSCSGTFTPDQRVCDAQAAYQAAASSLGLSPIPTDPSGAGPIDGEPGPNTITALNSYLASVGATFSFACSGGLLATQGTLQQLPSGGTPAPAPTPAPPSTTPPVIVPPSTTTVTTSSSSGSGAALAIGALVLAGAAGGWYFMSKHGPTPALAHAHARAHRAPARRRR